MVEGEASAWLGGADRTRRDAEVKPSGLLTHSALSVEGQGHWHRWAIVAVWIAAVTVAFSREGAGESPCAGDCNGDGTVSINELITGVNVALSIGPLSACPVFDVDGNGHLTIEELVLAVNNALAGCRGGTLDDGLRALSAGNLVSAQRAFADAATSQPGDAVVQLYALASRLTLEILTNERVLASLAANGARLLGTPSDLCSLHTEGNIIVPPSAPRLDEVVGTMRDVLQPRLREAASGLQVAIDASTQVLLDTRYLPSCVEPPISLPILDVDRGDLLAGRAALMFLQGLIDLIGAYHTNIGMSDLINGPLGPAVTANPRALTLAEPDKLQSARQAFEAALHDVIAALHEIRAERENQDDDLLVVLDDDIPELERYMTVAELIRQSLWGEVVIPAQDGLPRSQRLNLSRLFDGLLSNLRPYLRFRADGDIDIHHFPDTTFGGITPELSQADIDELVAGGRLCAACTVDEDCAGFGPRTIYCGYCFEDCDSTLMRCVGDGSHRCPDGVFF